MINQSKTQSYLGASACVQNARAKPGGSSVWEGCQGVAARRRHEEARPRCLMGSRFGPSRGRVRALMTKPVSPALVGSPDATRAVSRFRPAWVTREVTSGQWHARFTGEVPRRLRHCGGVTRDDKARPKRRVHAPVARTASRWPGLQGCQQRQSRPGPQPAASTERQYRSEPCSGSGVMGKVSSANAATKWPARTSSGQLVVTTLRNVPQQSGLRNAAVRWC